MIDVGAATILLQQAAGSDAPYLAIAGVSGAIGAVAVTVIKQRSGQAHRITKQVRREVRADADLGATAMDALLKLITNLEGQIAVLLGRVDECDKERRVDKRRIDRLERLLTQHDITFDTPRETP